MLYFNNSYRLTTFVFKLSYFYNKTFFSNNDFIYNSII